MDTRADKIFDCFIIVVLSFFFSFGFISLIIFLEMALIYVVQGSWIDPRNAIILGLVVGLIGFVMFSVTLIVARLIFGKFKK